MNQLIGVIGAVALIAGLIILLRKSAVGSGKRLEDELFRLCRGDKQMMERLISHEQGKRQGRPRDAAIRAAIESIKRDNR